MFSASYNSIDIMFCRRVVKMEFNLELSGMAWGWLVSEELEGREKLGVYELKFVS